MTSPIKHLYINIFDLQRLDGHHQACGYTPSCGSVILMMPIDVDGQTVNVSV